MKALNHRRYTKRGQTLVEYALILAFISVVAIAVLISLGKTLRGTYTQINSDIALGAVESLAIVCTHEVALGGPDNE